MIKRNIIYTYILVLLMFLSTIAGCNHRSAIDETMDIADSLMISKPDSALAILKGIPASEIKGEETSARYALLKSMAFDKNYIDTTTFTVLQPAIDYYLQNGNPDEKLRTYYYQGRIYQNRGEDAAAMLSFMNASELRKSVKDSLLLGHTLVAQGALYLKQYKISEFIRSNKEAAEIYDAIGNGVLALNSYSKVINGYILLENKSAADSILKVCNPLLKKIPDGNQMIFNTILSYTVEFGSNEDIKNFLEKNKDIVQTNDEIMNIAIGYSKIGEYDKAMDMLSLCAPFSSTSDSLRFASIKIDILEKQGRYEEAYNMYCNFSAILSNSQKELISHDLLFSDKKHQLEIEKLMEIQVRDRIVLMTLCGILCLLIFVGFLYYQGYHNKTKRILVEKENENLRLEQENLMKEKEKAELERDKKALEAENLKLELLQIENERDHLRKLQKEQLYLAKPIQEVIKTRLDMLNGLLAKELTNNESHAEQYSKWIETARNDKKRFLDSTRLAFEALHPGLHEYLSQHQLSEDEMNYICLYAIGLRGKEVGEYIQQKRHYVISHGIRKKMGIDEHETNIGIYIRKLIDNF